MDNYERIWWIIYFVILFLITPMGWIIANSIHDHKSNNNDDDVDDIAMQTAYESFDKSIKEDHKKYYCEYCGSKVSLKKTNCKNCGAPINPNILKKG